jgi:DNA-binding SARP family transcriptional activator
VSTLRIRLFGSMELERDARPLARFPSRKVRDLFAYLALNRHTAHPREFLAGLLWGDSEDERARHSLNTTLWRLNGVLVDGAGESGRGYLRVTPQEIGFNPTAEFWLDVAEFESRCALADQAISSDEQAILYGQAISFYRGDLLPDCYEEWCSLERDRLQFTYLRALGRLVTYHGQRGDHDAAIDCARRILTIDPLREEVHRDLITLYLAAHQPSAALRQYRQCEEILQRELAVSPMRETQALLTRILAAEHQLSVRAVPVPRDLGTSSLLTEITRELAASAARVEAAVAAFNEAQARLQELVLVPNRV